MIFRAQRGGARDRYVPAELPRARPRRGASHARGAGPRGEAAESARGGSAASCARRATCRRCCFWRASGCSSRRVEAGRLLFPLSRGSRRGSALRAGRPRRVRAASGPPPPPLQDAAPVPYARIATELRDPPKILARIQAQGHWPHRPTALPTRRRAPNWNGAWRRSGPETLRVSPVGIHDNFFDLGGHSLLAVQLLSRVRQEFGVELSLEVVYSGDFTVAELAKAIEAERNRASGARPVRRAAGGAGSLSDEEVRELLAKESGEAPSDRCGSC